MDLIPSADVYGAGGGYDRPIRDRSLGAGRLGTGRTSGCGSVSGVGEKTEKCRVMGARRSRDRLLQCLVLDVTNRHFRCYKCRFWCSKWAFWREFGVRSDVRPIFAIVPNAKASRRKGGRRGRPFSAFWYGFPPRPRRQGRARRSRIPVFFRGCSCYGCFFFIVGVHEREPWCAGGGRPCRVDDREECILYRRRHFAALA